MTAIDSGLVFLPRFTTLVGESEFTTAPLDVSGQAGTQFQVWRGALRTTGGTPAFTLFIEESLDAQSWALGPSTPQGFPILQNATVFFSYSFRLRWFRLRISISGTNPMVSCWAEGILRAGDGGMWGMPGVNPLSATGLYADASSGAAGAVPGRPAEDPWENYRARAQQGPLPWEDRYRFYSDLAALYRATYRLPGALKNAPPLPASAAWIPNAAGPVAPPQLQLQQGP